MDAKAKAAEEISKDAAQVSAQAAKIAVEENAKTAAQTVKDKISDTVDSLKEKYAQQQADPDSVMNQAKDKSLSRTM